MTTTQFLIFVTAIFDFLTAIIVVPLSIIFRIYIYQIQSLYFCKFFNATLTLCVTPGSCLVFIITLVRYLHVCRPQLLHYIEPIIKSLCLIFATLAVCTSALEAISLPLRKPWEKIGNQYVVNCYSHNNNFGSKFLVHFKYVMLILVITGLVVLNILIIRNKLTKQIVKRNLRQNNVESPTVSIIVQENLDNSSNLHDVCDTIEENQSTKGGNGSKSRNNGHTLNTNDNSKEGEDRNSKADTLSDNNTSVVGAIKNNIGNVIRSDLYVYGSAVGSNTTDVTHSSKKRHVKKSKYPAREDIDSDIKRDVFVRRSTIKKKKTSTSIGQCSNQSFKGLSSTTLMLCIVSVLYVISYLPFCIFQLSRVDVEKLPYNVQKYVQRPIYLLFLMGCCTNPVVYTFVNQSFRSKCRSLFRL